MLRRSGRDSRSSGGRTAATFGSTLAGRRLTRVDATIRKGTHCAAARPHSFVKHTHHGHFAAPNAHHPHHFREPCRSCRQRLRREPVAAGRQRHLTPFASEPDGGLIVAPHAVTLGNRKLIIDLAARYRVPAVYSDRSFAESGGLISFGNNTADLFRRAASYIDLVLKGAKPADLPVQLPTKFELIVNLKTAKSLGLTIPEIFLSRADEVIE